jgi:hypothetical protein
MIRRSRDTASTLVGAALTAIILAGCGSATATPGRSTGPSPLASPVVASAGASRSAAASGSASASVPPSASPSPSDALHLPHVDAKLEDLLPSTSGGVDLEKFSLTLSAYMASTSGGDKALYAPWLVQFGKTPADVNLAVAADLTQKINFIVHAIKVPGVDAALLSSSFGEVAMNAGWPVAKHANWAQTGKTLLEITDPDSRVCGSLCAGFVYAKDSILYTIITDDTQLLLSAMIELP